MKKILTIVTMLTALAVYSQTTYTCADGACAVASTALGNADYNSQFAASRAISFPKTDANKTVLKDFETASISVNGTSKIYLTRYNPISNEIEIKGDDNQIYNLRKIGNVVVNFNNSKEVYKSIVYKNAFGQDVVDYFFTPNSNQKLLKQSSYHFVEAKPARSGYDKSKPAYYKEKTKYFFVDLNDNLVELSTNKKFIKSYYSSFSNDILAYIKSNKIKNHREADLLKLATYMQVLQSRTIVDNALASNNKK